jgi:nicotinate-nucleotide pyrophosphorylase (carboxylating)
MKDVGLGLGPCRCCLAPDCWHILGLIHMQDSLSDLIRAALAEDIGGGDITSEVFIPGTSRSRAQILAKESGVLSGVEIARQVMLMVDPAIEIDDCFADGQAFERGDLVMRLCGPTRSLLTAERTSLNFLQRLSGIATQTRRYVEAIRPHCVKLLDTRKTTPGWRVIEKAAVVHGGGCNHRMGLHDQVMVKDNHLMACGDLSALQGAIDEVQRRRPGMKVQLEAATLEQLRGFLTLRGVDMVLLDNMDCATLRKAVVLTAGRLFLEASGGITLATIHEFAGTGVDAISVGALTHSVKAIDLSLDFV